MARALQIPVRPEGTPWERGTDGRPELLSGGETIVFEGIEEAFMSCADFMDTRLSDVRVLDRSWLPDFDEVVGRCNMSLYSALLNSPWKPFLIPTRRILKSPEIDEAIRRDKHLSIIVDVSISQITHLLSQEENFIHIFYERDVDVPRWKEVVISVYIKERSYDDKMRLWELIEEKVRTKIEDIRKQMSKNERRKIDRLNEKLSVRVREHIF